MLFTSLLFQNRIVFVMKEKCRLNDMVFLSNSYHFHLKNIILLHLLHSTSDIHLLRFKIEFYSSKGNVGLTLFSVKKNLFIAKCYHIRKKEKKNQILTGTSCGRKRFKQNPQIRFGRNYRTREKKLQTR